MMKINAFILVLATLMVSPHVSFAQPNASLQDIRVECLGVEHDGSQTLLVQGMGHNKADAKEQAKKNAVMAVLFIGVRSGLGGCEIRPLITEVNAREKYARYFDIFFMDKGEYVNYVSMEDTRPHSQTKKKGKEQRKITITVRVLRSQLAERLQNDGILNEEKSNIEYY